MAALITTTPATSFAHYSGTWIKKRINALVFDA
jgi:hypothetical protein